jgi:hypothetical protein
MLARSFAIDGHGWMGGWHTPSHRLRTLPTQYWFSPLAIVLHSRIRKVWLLLVEKWLLGFVRAGSHYACTSIGSTETYASPLKF